jgi:O-succinylbenzoic acid--CoA ligase
MERAELRALVLATGAAETAGGMVFLAEPPRSAAAAARRRDLQAQADRRPPDVDGGWLAIATGGTGGGLRYARHDEITVSAAARGLGRHFGLERINAVDVLPPYHVSGLMARIRAAETGGTHRAWEWKRLESGEVPALPGRSDGWVLSLVPTQLQRLLGRPATVAWLRELRVIFVGGGPLWPALADEAAAAGLPLAPGYGMTETAAMVAALRPAEFLGGARSCGGALPHARLAIGADGTVRVEGESLFRGYWPEWRNERGLETDDRGEIDAAGHLRILGRRDAVIITGGKKVEPAEVEAALRGADPAMEVAVIGVPDAEWGEVVVACFPAEGAVGAEGLARAAAALAPPQRPKHYVPVQPWPRNAQGKLNRADLRAAVQARLGR